MTSSDEIRYCPGAGPSSVTGQPTVELGLPFSVASHAKAHLEVDRHESIPGFDVAVTLCAVDFVPAHMGPVMEINIIRRKENPDPGDRFSRLKVLELLLNFRVLGDDVLMAKEAFLNRWNSRILGALHKGVTEAAVDFFYACMDAVAERNGLPRPDRPARISEHEVCHQGKEQCRKDEPKVFSPRSARPRSHLRFMAVIFHIVQLIPAVKETKQTRIFFVPPPNSYSVLS